MAAIEHIKDETPGSDRQQQEQKSEQNAVELKTYKTFEPVSFPSNLESDPRHKNYLIFRATSHSQTKLGAMMTHNTMRDKQDRFMSSPGQVENTIGMIRMFMPNMNETYSHDYGTSPTSIFSELASKLDLDNIMSKDNLDATVGVFRDRIAQQLQKSDAVTQATGMRQLQNHVTLYKGTNLREQTFLFVLRPKSHSELQSIGKIIHYFRMHSAGVATKTTGGTDNSIGTIQVPPLWYIEERLKPSETGNNRNIDTFMMGPAVITNIRVNKTPDQVYQTVAGTSGDPISVELEITFKEVIPVYKKFWDTLHGNLGRVVTESPRSV